MFGCRSQLTDAIAEKSVRVIFPGVAKRRCRSRRADGPPKRACVDFLSRDGHVENFASSFVSSVIHRISGTRCFGIFWEVASELGIEDVCWMIAGERCCGESDNVTNEEQNTHGREFYVQEVRL